MGHQRVLFRVLGLVVVSVLVGVVVAGPVAGPVAAQGDEERLELLDRAGRSVRGVVDRAAADHLRPVYHFRPVANWMNDPNGTIYVDGVYHMFYQFNPYGDGWGNMHWGHARSVDLVNWEHEPIALWPTKSAGEDHVFSGCAALDADGGLVLFYTSVGDGRPNEQWIAVPGDDGLAAFTKPDGNPFITTARPGGADFGGGMRDPFIFRHEGRTLMVIGADTEDRSVIPLYESTDPGLREWDYLGELWSVSKDVMAFPECPNFFPLGGKHVLLLSPYRAVEYRVGGFDVKGPSFAVEREGLLDHSEQYYATNTAIGPGGQRVLFGWIRGFPEGRGWNGVQAVPRILTLDDADRPVQKPVEAIAGLHDRAFTEEPRTLRPGMHELDVAGDALHLRIEFENMERNEAVTIHLRHNRDDRRSYPIRVSRSHVIVPGLPVARIAADAVGSASGTQDVVEILLDRSVVEIFADGGRTVVSRSFMTSQPNDVGVSLEVTGGAVDLKTFDAWTIKPVMPGADRAALERDGF